MPRQADTTSVSAPFQRAIRSLLDKFTGRSRIEVALTIEGWILSQALILAVYSARLFSPSFRDIAARESALA